MKATKAEKFDKVRQLLMAERGNQTWEIVSETTYPTFQGEVTEARHRTQHGGYTTDEVLRPEYQLDGWLEAGYCIVESWKEDDGLICVELKQGPIKTVLEYRQYAE
jgi:hypothetical protein